jgi:hypothetical protein
MTKRRLHAILRARRMWPFRSKPRPAFAVFPVGRWDISGERRSAA